LVDQGYDKQLKPLEEIHDSGIEFGYPKGFDKIFYLSSNSRLEDIFARGETCSSSLECIDKIHKSGNFATFVISYAALYYKNDIKDHRTVCPLDNYDYNFVFMTTYMQKGSFFLESLNKFITLSIESGIAGKALSYSAFVTMGFRNTADLSDEYFVFTLSHLHIAFYILFLGHSFSLLMFLCEVLYQLRLR
jgi:hypothetical protein